MERLAFGRESLAELATVRASVPKRDGLLEFRYCRKAENCPLIGLAQQKAGQIVHVDALHDDDDRAGSLVVEARQQRVREPLVRIGSLCSREGVIGLQRIVDNDDVAASTGKGA